MNRHNHLRLFRNRRGDKRRVDIESPRVDIHEYRLGTGAGNTTHRSKKRKRRRNNLVTDADIQTHQTVQNCIGTTGNTDRKFTIAYRRYLLFQLGHFRTADAALRFKHFRNGG
ncbi:hypothetical protein ES703_120764 [subsurface metagenome]